MILPHQIISQHSSHKSINILRYPEAQVTEKIWLVAGRSYYIKALMKEGGGGDHLSVGVRYPDGKFDRPISKDVFLTPGRTTVRIIGPTSSLKCSLLLFHQLLSILVSFSTQPLTIPNSFMNHLSFSVS